MLCCCAFFRRKGSWQAAAGARLSKAVIDRSMLRLRMTVVALPPDLSLNHWAVEDAAVHGKAMVRWRLVPELCRWPGELAANCSQPGRGPYLQEQRRRLLGATG